jgi:hypothetical protein
MTKLPLRERRYKALLNQITRLTLARNKAIKTIVKAENTLPGLERRARRLEFPTLRNKAASPEPQPINKDTADVLERLIGHPPSNPVKPEPTEPTEPTEAPESVPLAKIGETEIGKANAESWNAVTKRRRKAPPGSEQAALLHTPPSSRKTKMEALGFRKV